jgi:hypothetical protein
MTVRSLDILDLPFLPRYRRNVLPLDSARLLTRGNPLGLTAMLSYLNPRRNIYTAISTENGNSIMGQVIMKDGDISARLTFIAPLEETDKLLPPLLEALTAQAGTMGTLYLLAEVDEDSPVFKSLRQAGFAMYAWQRIWKLPYLKGVRGKYTWREAEDSDWPAVQSMHAQIVPALIQPVDALPKQATGLVCSAEGEIQAYVREDSGPEGIWLQPLVPPDSTCASEQISGLIRAVSNNDGRPVYVCVRSYLAWLESSLGDLGAEAGAREAVMVKRLASMIKESQPVSVVEQALAKAKPAAPVSRIESKE